MDFKFKIAHLLYGCLKDEIQGIGFDDILLALELPKGDMGDLAYPCFRLAKSLKKAPQVIAQQLYSKIVCPDFLDKLEVSGAYINFFISRRLLSVSVLSDIFAKGCDYGKQDIGDGACVVIDYSSPNIGKPFHVGHLRSTIIGHSLYNIFNCLGYNSFSINYLGDWGNQFGKLIAAYKRWGVKEEVDRDGIMAINRLYVRFHEESLENKGLEDEARAWFVKMQENDDYALSLWRWFSDVSLYDYEKTYKRLSISFDSYKGESFYNDKMMPVVEELTQKGLLTEDDGAMIVNLDDYKMPPCLILRRDGGTLYPTRDIASVLYRKSEYNFVKCLYVTGQEQILHFSQWFKVVELMGYKWASELSHVPFGMINFADGKMSTRHGKVLLMEDLLNEAVNKILQIIDEKNPNLQNKELVAEQVGIGAIKFNDLYNSRIKDVEFSWERMLNFEGETGPYVQYTFARCSSVIEKGQTLVEDGFKDAKLSLLINDDEFALIKVLGLYPEKIREAAGKYEPFVVSRYIMQVAQAYNKFYHDNSILKADEELKKARLYLCVCVKYVLQSGLLLLGIETPERM